jgi:hypothetical protein
MKAVPIGTERSLSGDVRIALYAQFTVLKSRMSRETYVPSRAGAFQRGETRLQRMLVAPTFT